nr:hypothetical protein [Hyphomicrobiales bacterium]
MSRVARLLACLLIAAPVSASAQDAGSDIFAPSMVAPEDDFGIDSPPEDFAAPVPYAPSVDGAPAGPFSMGVKRLMLEARLIESGEPLRDGLTWRVFGIEPAEDGKLP